MLGYCQRVGLHYSKSTYMKILYVGKLKFGDTSYNRYLALRDIVEMVEGVNLYINNRLVFTPIYRFLRRYLKGLYEYILVAMIRHKLRRFDFDVIYFDKPNYLSKKNLSLIKSRHSNIRVVSYSPDDMMNKNNSSTDYVDCIGLYDLHVTTKTFNCDELKALGARKVLYVHNSYSKFMHRPVPLTLAEKSRFGGGVGFIGAYEKERELFINFLATSGVQVKVYGPWKQKAEYHNNMLICERMAWGNDYAKTISAFDINLCFLRKENRDLQTSRSIEIPACGGFMLAERTVEHLELFKEGVEAEFFDSKEEMVDKVIYYLKHPIKRQKIALGGYNRCIDSMYSDHEKMAIVIENIRLA